MKLSGFVRRHNINNVRIGEVTSKEGTRHTVRVGSTQITCHFDGEVSVGQMVTLECLDGDLNKGYIKSAAPIGIAHGGNVAI